MLRTRTNKRLWSTVYSIDQGAWSGWSEIGAAVSSSPSAVRYRDDEYGGATFVFARGDKGQLERLNVTGWSKQPGGTGNWGAVTGGSVNGDPACFAEGINDGIPAWCAPARPYGPP